MLLGERVKGGGKIGVDRVDGKSQGEESFNSELSRLAAVMLCLLGVNYSFTRCLSVLYRVPVRLSFLVKKGNKPELKL